MNIIAGNNFWECPSTFGREEKNVQCTHCAIVFRPFCLFTILPFCFFILYIPFYKPRLTTRQDIEGGKSKKEKKRKKEKEKIKRKGEKKKKIEKKKKKGNKSIIAEQRDIEGGSLIISMTTMLTMMIMMPMMQMTTMIQTKNSKATRY